MHHCRLEEGQTGRCRARKNVEGRIESVNYGRCTALALDPIEKKPLRRFYPGKSCSQWAVLAVICPVRFVRIMKSPWLVKMGRTIYI